MEWRWCSRHCILGQTRTGFQICGNWRICGQGAFVIRGQRTWYKDIDLRLGIGLVAINGIPLLMASTAKHIAEICTRYIVVTPGREKKESIANKIYKSTGLQVDDILPILPGNCEIIEDVGLINFKKSDNSE